MYTLIHKNTKTEYKILLLVRNSCEEFEDLNEYYSLKSNSINLIIKVGEMQIMKN